jgi:hypothetical protein
MTIKVRLYIWRKNGYQYEAENHEELNNKNNTRYLNKKD